MGLINCGGCEVLLKSSERTCLLSNFLLENIERFCLISCFTRDDCHSDRQGLFRNCSFQQQKMTVLITARMSTLLLIFAPLFYTQGRLSIESYFLVKSI